MINNERQNHREEYELESHGAFLRSIPLQVIDVDSHPLGSHLIVTGGRTFRATAEQYLNKNIAFSQRYVDKDVLQHPQRATLRGI
jgi:hypothetical protein